MTAPLNQTPPQRGYQGTVRRPDPRTPVVPRVYVEPDEQMDRLRRRALRWSIVRDIVAITVGLYLLASWLLTGA